MSDETKVAMTTCRQPEGWTATAQIQGDSATAEASNEEVAGKLAIELAQAAAMVRVVRAHADREEAIYADHLKAQRSER